MILNKRAGLYIRVSTTEQANEGYSIPAQTEKLKAYAMAMDYTVVKIYTDPGYSGAKLERPAMQEMMTDIKNKQLDVIVVYKLDRLSRSQKNTLYLIQDVFKPNGVDFISMQESFDTSTSFGMAMVGILSAFAELERSTITERMMLGRKERARQGYYHGGGNYEPLGYHYIDGELVIDEYEAEIVRDMYRTYLEGNSMNTTAQMMWDKYPERVKSKTLIRDALQNPLYTGKVNFDGEIYDGLHELIIDSETFNKAQVVRKKRGLHATATNKQKGLLVGKIYCAHCGARFGREVTGSQKYRYINYTCYSRRKASSRHMVKDENCKNKRWKESKLDELVIHHIKALDFNELKKQKKKVTKRDYTQDISTLDNQMTRLIDLYTLGTVDIKAIDSKLKTLQTKKEFYVEKMQLQEEETIPKPLENRIKNFDWENSVLKDKLSIVDLLVKRIEIDNDNIKVLWNF